MALESVPAVPVDVHTTLAKLVALAPVVIFTAILFEQTVSSDPAAPAGAFVIVTILVDVAFVQLAFPVAVRVRVTLPAVMSAAPGVYVQPVSEVAFVRVPAAPLDVQKTPALFDALAPVVMFTPVVVRTN